MRITTIEAGTFGSEQLYKIVIDGKTQDQTGPLSGRMSQLAMRVLNGEDEAKVFATESRNYAARVMDVVESIRNPQPTAGA